MIKISAKKGVQQLIQRFKHVGIRHIVISPGSRNAPLIISFSQDPYFTTYSIPDERSAAFYALGMAEELGEPVAIACTSGSAILNYYPAIAEAFYRSIPLIVLSADRPLAWIDHGDGQTIRQRGVLSHHIMAEMELLESPILEKELEQNSSEFDRVFDYVFRPWKGPVHINCPFTEPLYESEPALEEDNTSTKRISRVSHELSNEDISYINTTWLDAKNIMILCGQMPHSPELHHILNSLSEHSHVAIIVENTSNLAGNRFIHCIDRTLNSIPSHLNRYFQPDLLISIGGAIISKRIKSFLRDSTGVIHWRVGFEFPEMDTYRHLTRSFEDSANHFLRHLPLPQMDVMHTRFGEQWKQLDFLIQLKHEEFFADGPFTDIQVFHYLMDIIPEDSKLHMANSSVVRYCQLFDPIKSIRYTGNRGTSGIDGSTSTAIGAAIANPDLIHTIITGDISFFYDSNALWNHHLPSNIRIILINNGGGGIFKIIPGPDKTDELEQHFVARQHFHAAPLCQAFDVSYLSARTVDELDQAMQHFYQPSPNQRPVLLEVFTPSDANPEELNRYFREIKVEPKIFT